MGDIKSTYSNHEIFVLKSDIADALVMKKEPKGWTEDSIRFTRHKDYHGIFTSFTNSLTFYKEYKEYILLAYKLGGINVNTYLTKYELKDVDGEVKWVEKYTAIADYKTKKEVDGGLEINFNSNDLEELLSSHKTDTFEIERLTSIDDDDLDVMDLFNVELSGRTLTGISESKINLNYNSYDLSVYPTFTRSIIAQGIRAYNNDFNTAVTEIVTRGNDRFSSVDAPNRTAEASQMFIVDDIDPDETLEININYDLEFYAGDNGGADDDNNTLKAYFRILEWNGVSYDEILLEEIFSETYVHTFPVQLYKFNISGTKKYTLKHNQGIMIGFKNFNDDSGSLAGTGINFTKHEIKVVSEEFYENSPNLTCSFFHDTMERLMYIITGQKNKFYSKYFGRTELGYKEDGEGGLMGLMSGYWARDFDPETDKYKSLQISIDDCITSAQAVHNIGVGIEKFNLSKRLRFEKLEYFYQNRAIIKLPYQLKNVVRTIDSNLFFSGTSLGYDYGGEYEDEIGLDEPNTISENVTPIRKSDKKYNKKSKVRSDDYGLEIIRRKPQILFPEEDTSMDDHNWWLDLKRTDFGFTQKIWSDRLEKLPTGINAPEDYKGMFFTPLRMLLRHGFVIKSAIEVYADKLIKNINVKGNKNLSMQFIGEDKEYKENSDILVSDLKRSRFTEDIIEGEHVITSDLLDLIQGTTKMIINGEEEEVPNIYFPIEFINEKEELELGYILDINPEGNGKIKFQKYNDKLI